MSVAVLLNQYYTSFSCRNGLHRCTTTCYQKCSTHQQYKNFHKATLIRIFNKLYIRNNVINPSIIQTFPKDRYVIISALYYNISIRSLMY